MSKRKAKVVEEKPNTEEDFLACAEYIKESHIAAEHIIDLICELGGYHFYDVYLEEKSIPFTTTNIINMLSES